MQNQKVRFHNLIREFHAIYENLASNGHDAGSHIQSVTHKLASIIESPLQVAATGPEKKPVCRYLGTAIDAGTTGPYASLANAFEQVTPLLRWEYGYSSMPDDLYDTYAYTEITGPNGNVYAADIVLGFVLLAPGCFYPEHNHPGIEESYLCVSGRVVQNDNEVLHEGDFLYNRPGKMHSLAAGADSPCLLGYGWNASRDVLTGYTMKFG